MQSTLTFGLGLVLLLAGGGWLLTVLRFRTFVDAPGKLPLLIWLYVPILVMMAQSLLDPPNFAFDQPVDLSSSSASLGQVATVLGYTAIVISLALAYLRRLPTTKSRVLQAGLVYYGLFLIAAPLSTVPVFPRTALTGFGVVLAVWAAVSQGVTLVWLVREAQRALYVVLYGSLALWLLDQTNYTTNAIGSGILSDQRLFGLTSHPNQIGFFAGLAIILGLYSAGRLRWWRWHMLVAFSVLLLAGSKTAAGAALIALSLAAFTQLWTIRATSLRTGMALLLVAVLGSGAVLIGTSFDETIPTVDTTFSGRESVWDKTLAEFSDNPLAGYGPTLWDSDYRAAQAMLWVGQAHNQGVQALGEAGILGATGLALLLIVTLGVGVTTARTTGGMSIALAVYVIVRMWSESSLIASGVGSSSLFGIIVWLGVLALAAHQAKAFSRSPQMAELQGQTREHLSSQS